MPLAEVVGQFCTRPLATGWIERPRDRCDASLARPLAELEQRIQELERVKRIATETRALLERLVSLLDRPAEFNRLIARVDEMRAAITALPQIYNLVIEVSATGELRRHMADRQMARADDDGVAGARRRLTRDQEFVCAFLEGCEFLEKTLPETAARLREDRR
jgi:hypothetical protein